MFIVDAYIVVVVLVHVLDLEVLLAELELAGRVGLVHVLGVVEELAKPAPLLEHLLEVGPRVLGQVLLARRRPRTEIPLRGRRWLVVRGEGGVVGGDRLLTLVLHFLLIGFH